MYVYWPLHQFLWLSVQTTNTVKISISMADIIIGYANYRYTSNNHYYNNIVMFIKSLVLKLMTTPKEMLSKQL